MARDRSPATSRTSPLSGGSEGAPLESPRPVLAPTSALDELPVGARLQHFWPMWESLGASSWVVSVLRWGYQLEFDRTPPLSSVASVPSERKNPAKNAIIQEQINILLAKGALEEVRAPAGPGFYSLLFVRPKPNGTWRPIIDLSVLNRFLRVKRFKMETVKSICSLLHQGAWTFSIDLTDAYFHIPIHKASRKFLRICFQGRVFQFRALPFGIAIAPWLFTKVMASVKLSVDVARLSLFQYLDDWLGECLRRRVCSQEAANLVCVCKALGLMVNLEKSELVPAQIFTFIGVTFNLKDGLMFPTEKNVRKIVEAVTQFLQASCHTAQQWESLLGTLGSQDRFVRWGRFHLRPIQLHFLSRWRPSTGRQTDLVPLPDDLRPHLRWWLDTERLLQGIPLEPPEVDVKLFTDASTSGWGAHLDGHSVQGVWTTDEASLHINVLEMRAVRLALEEFGVAEGANILVASDNATVVAYVNTEGGTRSHQLWLATVPLLHLAITLVAQGAAHSGEAECHRRSAEPGRPDPAHGVVTASRRGEMGVLPVGTPICSPRASTRSWTPLCPPCQTPWRWTRTRCPFLGTTSGLTPILRTKFWPKSSRSSG